MADKEILFAYGKYVVTHWRIDKKSVKQLHREDVTQNILCIPSVSIVICLLWGTVLINICFKSLNVVKEHLYIYNLTIKKRTVFRICLLKI